MGTDKFLTDFKLSNLGFTPDELEKRLVVILYEQGCETYISDIKYGIISNGCAGVAVPIPQFDAFNASKSAKEMLLPSRETVADLTEAILSLYRADGAVVVATSDICLSGAIMGIVRKNVPLCAMSVVNICAKNKDSLLIKSLMEAGKISLSDAESTLNTSCDRIDDFFSLALFLEGAGISVLNGMRQNKTVLARNSGAMVAKRAIDLSYPKKDLTINAISTGLATMLSVKGTSASLLHIVAIARENGLDVDFDFVESVAGKTHLADVEGKASEVVSMGAGAIINGLIDKKSISPAFNGYLSHFGQELGDQTAHLDGECTLSLVKGNVVECGIMRFEGGLKPFKGQVKAYESEELARSAIFGGVDFSNSVIAIVGQGANDNGMPPLDIESALIAVESQNTIIVTDGRLVEFGVYPSISLVDKESGFLAMRSGDMVEIDFKKGKFNLSVPNKELNSRLKKMDNATPQNLMRYTNYVSPCSKGCLLKK